MIIEVENLVKRYGEHIALDHLDLKIREGEVFGILGPRGSGKTTLFYCLMGMLSYDKGSIKLWGGEKTGRDIEWRKDVGIVLQESGLFDELTIYENIDYFCGLYIDDKKKREDYVIDAMKFCALNEFADFYPSKLSGGLLQRVNIACGIAHKPKLVILDEPIRNVDLPSRKKILESIRQLNENGTTILYLSNKIDETEEISTQLAMMDRGKIIAQGSAEELKNLIGTGEKIYAEGCSVKLEVMERLRKFPNINKAVFEKQVLSIQSRKAKHNLPEIIQFLEQNEVTYEKIHVELPTLRDVFLELTGKEL